VSALRKSTVTLDLGDFQSERGDCESFTTITLKSES
jgi:hypothetical protein